MKLPSQNLHTSISFIPYSSLVVKIVTATELTALSFSGKIDCEWVKWHYRHYDSFKSLMPEHHQTLLERVLYNTEEGCICLYLICSANKYTVYLNDALPVESKMKETLPQ